MKKTLMTVLAILMILTMVACGTSEPSDSQGDLANDSIESVDETNVEATSEVAEEGQSWPDVIPTDVLVLSGVTIEGYWPMETGASEYTVNFSVSEEDKAVIRDYVTSLTTAGYTQKSVSENNFGVDYVYNNDKYQVFINVVYGGASKLTFTAK